MTVEKMVEQLRQLMAERCYDQAEELCATISDHPEATERQLQIADSFAFQILQSECEEWG